MLGWHVLYDFLQINNRWLLSVASCIGQDSARNVEIWTVPQNETNNGVFLSRVSRVFNHPSFGTRNIFDYSLIKTAKVSSEIPYMDRLSQDGIKYEKLLTFQPLTLSSTLTPVCLSQSPEPLPETTCYITYWGKPQKSTKDGFLHQADIRLRSTESCIDNGPYKTGIVPENICAGDGKSDV